MRVADRVVRGNHVVVDGCCRRRRHVVKRRRAAALCKRRLPVLEKDLIMRSNYEIYQFFSTTVSLFLVGLLGFAG